MVGFFSLKSHLSTWILTLFPENLKLEKWEILPWELTYKECHALHHHLSYVLICLHNDLFTPSFVYIIIYLHNHLFIESFVYPIIWLQNHLFIQSFVYRIICLPSHLFTQSFVYTIICLHNHLFTQSFVYTIICVHNHLVTQSFGYAIIWLRNHLFTQSFVYMICLHHHLFQIKILELWWWMCFISFYMYLYNPSFCSSTFPENQSWRNPIPRSVGGWWKKKS